MRGTPFVIDARRFDGEAVHLLPSADAVIALGPDGAVVVMPHDGVHCVDRVAEVVRLAPNVVKCLLGPPRELLGRVLRAEDHPMLAPFAPARSLDEVAGLLHDLRASLTETGDEVEFGRFWRAMADSGTALPTSDRQVQRLARRFAGRSPSAVNRVVALGRTLDADRRVGGYNSLGLFADASHLARVCRALTGETPGHWRNVSHAFYSSDRVEL